MGFAGRWLVGTVAVMALVLVASLFFVEPGEDRNAEFVYEIGEPSLHVYEAETPTRIEAEKPLRERVSDAKRDAVRLRCREYYDMAKVWRMVKKRYPRGLRAMEAPLRPGDANYATIAKDPWGNEYYLELVGQGIRIWSWGPDAEEGTDDDICYPADD